MGDNDSYVLRAFVKELSGDTIFDDYQLVLMDDMSFEAVVDHDSNILRFSASNFYLLSRNECGSILAHEMGHIIQNQDNVFRCFSSSHEMEYNADKRIKDFNCGYIDFLVALVRSHQYLKLDLNRESESHPSVRNRAERLGYSLDDVVKETNIRYGKNLWT